MGRPPEFNNWPWPDYGWAWGPTGMGGKPGHAHVLHFDSNQAWDVDIRVVDKVAQNHFTERATKPGLPVRMPDGKVFTIPFPLLDDEADALVKRGMKANTDRSSVVVRTVEGQALNHPWGVPRDWWEQQAADHLQRRQQEQPILLKLPTLQGQMAQLNMSFECFDHFCKDFMLVQRNRFVSAGAWPELLIQERPMNPDKPGPMPVDGRANAFGEGAVPLTPQQLQQAQQQGAGPHPAVEQQDLA